MSVEKVMKKLSTLKKKETFVALMEVNSTYDEYRIKLDFSRNELEEAKKLYTILKKQVREGRFKKHEKAVKNDKERAERAKKGTRLIEDLIEEQGQKKEQDKNPQNTGHANVKTVGSTTKLPKNTKQRIKVTNDNKQVYENEYSTFVTHMVDKYDIEYEDIREYFLEKNWITKLWDKVKNNGKKND